MNPKLIATAVGGLFFPQTMGLGMDESEYSPALKAKIVFAGINCTSYAAGHQQLKRLADLDVNTKAVERATDAIGRERVEERDAAVQAFQELPLVEKFQTPVGVTPSEVAVVMVDGGRLQIRDEPAVAATSTTAATTPAVEASASVVAGGVEPTTAAMPKWKEEIHHGHWREDKGALLLSMTSAPSEQDPCPEVPASFVNVLRIPKLVRELKKNVKAGEEAAAEATDEDAEDALGSVATPYQPPQVKHRQVLASRQPWADFASQVAAAAWAAGFQGAARKGFVADGAANNWTLQRRFFSSFTPILDFIHALSYVYAGAQAGHRFSEGWKCYQQWIAQVWKGQISAVLLALEARQVELGQPEADTPATDPRAVVARSLAYLRNHADKMDYPAYRKAGLPLTSSLMESTIKQLNRRVKGTEKFWTEEGSEGVLQLRADELSDGEPLRAFWQRRQAAATGQRSYRRVG